MDVLSAEGELLLVHNTSQKKGVADGTHQNTLSSDYFLVDYTWTVGAGEAPYILVPYMAPKKSAKFTLSTSKGRLEETKTENNHEIAQVTSHTKIQSCVHSPLLMNDNSFYFREVGLNKHQEDHFQETHSLPTRIFV